VWFALSVAGAIGLDLAITVDSARMVATLLPIPTVVTLLLMAMAPAMAMAGMATAAPALGSVSALDVVIFKRPISPPTPPN
jgi:hypothetical protein